MAKPLRTLRKQLASQGWLLLFSFDTSIEPGTIIERRKPRDVNQLGSIFKIPRLKEVEVSGPADVGLLDFSRTHELTLGAAAELIGAGKLKSSADRVRAVHMSLDRALKWYITDKIALFSMLAGDPDWPSSAQARRLAMKRHFLVTDVVRTRIRFTFEGKGGTMLEADATKLADLKAIGLSGSFKWENRYELAAAQELTVAFEAVRWRPRRGIFQTLSA